MLPKKHRILRQEIQEVLKTAKRYNSPHFLLYVQNQGLKLSKFAFTVSKKISPTAVERNKLRRRGYAVITKHLKSVRPGLSCLFVYKKGSASAKYQEIEVEIEKLLYLGGVVR